MFYIFQGCFMILVGIIIISQIVVPAIAPDLPFFWIFKKSYKELQKAEGDLAISKVDKETREIRDKISKVDKE